MGAPPKEYWDEKLKNFPPKGDGFYEGCFNDNQDFRYLLAISWAVILLFFLMLSFVPEQAMMDVLGVLENDQ